MKIIKIAIIGLLSLNFAMAQTQKECTDHDNANEVSTIEDTSDSVKEYSMRWGHL